MSSSSSSIEVELISGIVSSRVGSSRVGPFLMFDGEIMSVGSETTLFVGGFVLSGRLETILTFSGYFRIFEPRVYFSCSDIRFPHPRFGFSFSGLRWRTVQILRVGVDSPFYLRLRGSGVGH